MYNFSGVLYRIWGVSGIILFIGVVCMLFEKPWAKNFKIQKCKFELFMIAFGICLGMVYAFRIVFPDVSSYTGAFVESRRDSSVAPPLPFTYAYVFWNGEGKKQVFYLDSFSKEEIFLDDFETDQEYTIYFDKLTDVITKVEVIEKKTGDGS